MAAQSQTTLTQQSQQHLNTAVSIQSAQSQPQLNSTVSIQSAQSHQQQPQPTQHHNSPMITTTTQQPTQQASPIILPGNLNHPLLLNQMPVILQQNAPQGVQLILRPPTPQIAVIHNSRPQIQTQQQPQQLLRIVNANGQMQLAATPTFIVSSQSNLIQQNLQGMKAQSTNPLNQLQGLTSQNPQQSLAAAINSQLIGRSMAQLQNLQLNGNLAQIQMPNGLNGQFISQLPAQFQQNVTGFNQFNQLSNTNFQQLATAATGTAFQSPPPQQQNTNDMVVAAPNIQFTTQQTPISVSVAQSLPSSQIIGLPSQQPQLISTPEPIRNPTPITILPNNAVIVPNDTKNQVLPPIIQTQSNATTTSNVTADPATTTKKAAKKPKKPKAKKDTAAVQPINSNITQTTTSLSSALSNSNSISQSQNQLKFVSSAVSNSNYHYQNSTNQTVITTQANNSQSSSISSTSQLPSLTTSTGKLDLGNVMKLCGIMDDDDFMETDETQVTTQSSTIYDNNPTSINSSTPNDIMVTIPYVQNSDVPFSFTIPNIESGMINTTASTYTDTLVHSTISRTNAITSIPALNAAGDNNKTITQDRQYMIKIDNNDGTPPFPLSITLPHNLGPPDNNESNKLIGIPNIVTPISSSYASQTNHTHLPLVNPTITTTPTLQSQINKIQNQLIGVQNSFSNNSTNVSNTISASHINLNANIVNSLSTTTTTTTTTTQKATKKKQSNKRNGKKVMETINVPSQIGNIQISQVDRTKTSLNQSGKAVTIENQIQITPIIDSMKRASTPNASQQTVLAMASTQTAPTLNSMINNQTIAMNLQPNQQILNIPNNVQIISSSASNNLNTHPNIITNSISTIHAGNGATGGVLINTGQPIQTQIGLQRPPLQSSNVQTINNQGNFQNSNSHITQSTQAAAHRQLQMTMQPSPNIQMQMLQSSMHADASQLTSLPQLTGSLSLTISEDGRLFLKHNPNAPQDSQSQTILQAVLSGALCNVTLINETSTPTPAQPQNIQPPNIASIDNSKPSIIVKTNDLAGIQNISQTKPNSINNVVNAQVSDKPMMVSYLH